MKKNNRVILLPVIIIAFLVTCMDFTMLSAKSVKPVKLRYGISTAKRITSNIKIDGAFKEKNWSVKTPIKQREFAKTENKAYYGMLWNKNYLYVGIKVYDKKLVNDSADIRDDDSVQVYLDMNNNHFTHYDLFDSYYKIGYKDKNIWEKFNKTTGVRQVSKKTSYGYNVEIAFPWSTIMVSNPKTGMRFGLDVGVADDDNGGAMDSLLTWFGASDNEIFTQNFGDCYLNNTKNTLKLPKHPKKSQPSYYHFKNYFEYVYPKDPFRIVRLWIPSTTKTVKGLIIIGNGGNGDWRHESSHRELQIFAGKYGYGVVSHKGIVGSNTFSENGKIILDALKLFAKNGKKPELANVPFIYSGSSSGGASAYGMMNYVPGRVIAITSNVTASFNPQTPVDAALKVPAMFTTGELDNSYINKSMENTVRNARARGALWSWLAIQGMAHEHQRTYHMFLPFWAECINARVPKDADPKNGPVKLNEIDMAGGWLADDTSWTSGCTTIASYNDYTGDKSLAGWIINKDIAYLYRGLSTWNRKLKITMDQNPASFDDPEYTLKILKPGDEIKLNVVSTGLTGALKKVEFYLGGNLIGETTGTSITYKLGNQSVSQTFTALGYDEAGQTYSSDILGVIVNPG